MFFDVGRNSLSTTALLLIFKSFLTKNYKPILLVGQDGSKTRINCSK